MFRSPYHLVTYSPWPFLVPIFMGGMAAGLISWMHTDFWGIKFMMIMFFMIIFSSYVWWRDVLRESSGMGYHTNLVMIGLRLGVILFIVSEVLFFFAFFWTFFHSGSDSMMSGGESWPPNGLKVLNAFEVPFLNTIVLLSSGVTLTLSHVSVMKSKSFYMVFFMVVTVILGVYFTFLQWGEYMESSYNFSDNSFGSIFFTATGFHGVHVLIGSVFLSVCLVRLVNLRVNYTHHVGFEAAAWYWHFVDVVWLFLFLSVYWWGC